MTRKIHLVAFMQAQNCTTIPAAWRHPEARPDFTSAAYFQHIAQVLEHGKFDVAFFDDRLAMPDMYTGDHAHTVEHGIRAVKMDAATVMMAMGMGCKHLGLGATYSTTYLQPFHVARLFQSVDLMLNGRAAWNVVTSVNDNEAKNMGLDGVIAHDNRYDMADEFMEAVLGHWDSWDDDAIILDKNNGVFAKPGSVRRIDYKGQYFQTRGPFTVPRSPQGRPVIMQAGASGRGQKFAARWGELLFTAPPHLAAATAAYNSLKSAAEANGRDPNNMKIAALGFPIAAATKAEAEDKRAFYDTLPNEVDQLSLLSEALNYDFGSKGLDEPFTDSEMAGVSGMQTMRDRVVQAGYPNPTPRDFMEVTQRGRLNHAWVGGPKEIADIMEEWFTTPACDGFVIGPSWLPGSFEDFVTHIVPELQRRGLYRKEYSGTTLRDHLGLAKASVGDWKL
jgi:FMN-dependent oxidoreductase (nitrilotriacetate monooxygenase family)